MLDCFLVSLVAVAIVVVLVVSVSVEKQHPTPPTTVSRLLLPITTHVVAAAGGNCRIENVLEQRTGCDGGNADS